MQQALLHILHISPFKVKSHEGNPRSYVRIMIIYFRITRVFVGRMGLYKITQEFTIIKAWVAQLVALRLLVPEIRVQTLTGANESEKNFLRISRIVAYVVYVVYSKLL